MFDRSDFVLGVFGTTVTPELQKQVNPSAASKVILSPLTSLRFLAALHIFLFHIGAMPSPEEMKRFADQMQGNQPPREVSPIEAAAEGTAEVVLTVDAREGGQPAPIQGRPDVSEGRTEDGRRHGIFADLPSPLERFIQRGFCSTSLFFMLSGFILAYLYIDSNGNQTVSNRDFWLARWARIYPLHFLMLFLMVPVVLYILSLIPTPTIWGISTSKSSYFVVSGLMSVLLIQAWCPELALSWNFATWALSAVVFFYAVFPWLVRWLKGTHRKTLWCWFWIMPILNLIPSVVFLTFTDGNPMTNFFWSEVVMRTPLLWLPHFVMGIVLARIFQITRHDLQWMTAPCSGRICWGDMAAIILVGILMLTDNVFQTLFGLGAKPPNFILRHGALAPLFAVVIYHLALNRGWFAKSLSHPSLEKLGQASFGIFLLQGPMIFPCMTLFGGAPSLVRASLTVTTIVATSLLTLRYIERPLAGWLKNRWKIASSAT